MSFHPLCTLWRCWLHFLIRRNPNDKTVKTSSHGRWSSLERIYFYSLFSLNFRRLESHADSVIGKLSHHKNESPYIIWFDGFLRGVSAIVWEQFVKIFSKHNGNFQIIIIRIIWMSVLTWSSGLLFSLSHFIFGAHSSHEETCDGRTRQTAVVQINTVQCHKKYPQITHRMEYLFKALKWHCERRNR